MLKELILMNKEIIKFNRFERMLHEPTFNLLEIIKINILFIFKVDKDDKMFFIQDVIETNNKLEKRLKENK